MSDPTPQEEGRAWEPIHARRVGAKPVAQSGAGKYKLDAGQRALLWSCKWTGSRSIRVDEHMLRELDDATSGAGGIGQDVTGLLVIRFEPLDREIAMVDLDKLIALFETDAQLIPPTKDAMRRRRAGTPALYRDD
jgi:hypothetical protein